MTSLTETSNGKPVDEFQHLRPAQLIAGLMAFEGLLREDEQDDCVWLATRLIAYVLAQLDSDDKPHHRNCPTLWFNDMMPLPSPGLTKLVGKTHYGEGE